MISLPGYEIAEEIISGVRTTIYRGTRKRDGKPAIVKVLKSEYPTLSEIACLRQEYTIPQSLDCEGIIKTYSLETYGNGYALILEDIGGQALSQVIASEKIPLAEFLTIGLSLVSTLGELHEVPVIHKDIKPSNIIVNTKTGEVRLTDFGLASRLDRENPTIQNPDLLEGTLAYMSPEQTGRMNRSLDYRSDFYSLGITFYEILTGQLPFTATEPMELVHCHIAKQPVPPHKLDPDIPEVISSIVMKLLAKTAEDRYQSAAGLKYDLETCLERLQTTGHLQTEPEEWNFTPGKRDRGNQLLIPQKLYGRESEVQTLMDAFERVSNGASEMMLVSGYSGIGKTAIVNEVHKPIVKARGYFTAGKFDQFKRNIPYAALIQAFSELIGQLLTEGARRIAVWKEKLLDALGPNGQVIVEVIPDVELIIGQQPAVPQLGPSESLNRFNRVFQQFIRIFCQAEHPLVIFLDDLQWADSASLKLIQMLMGDADSQYLLAIGAYRDNEVDATHPLIQTVEKMAKASIVVNDITVGPLEMQQVGQLVAETLDETEDEPPSGSSLVALKNRIFGESAAANSWISPRSRVYGLVELAFNKTQGNPFFLTQLLKTLYSENLLVYDVGTGTWEWDIREIQAVGIVDYNIIELVARNIQKLPETTQKVLKLAACIGNRFNLEMLAIANEESTQITAAQMWEALQSGLLLPLSDAYKIPLAFSSVSGGAIEGPESDPLTKGKALDVKVDYKFLHDRVQQAAYSLIPESEKKETHLKIGKQLLENTTAEERNENIFALVNQLNYGRDLLAINSERNNLANLNLVAGQKAKAAAAYEASLNYLKVGLGLLQADCWQKNYDLTFSLHLESVEAEYLNSNFEGSKELADRVLDHAKTLLEKIKVYELQIQAYIAENQMQKALDLGQQILQMLGVCLKEQEPPKDTNIEALADLPEMTDLARIAALRILNGISTPAYIGNPALWLQISFTGVNLCINYGNSPLAALVYINYAMFLCGMEDSESGYKFGKLALRVLDEFDAKKLKSTILNLFNGHVRHWKEHVKETIEPLHEAVQSGLETGEMVYSGYAALSCGIHPFFIGEYLESVDRQFVHSINLLQKQNLGYHVIYGQIGRQLTLNLIGKSEDKLKLIGEAFNEEEMLPMLIEQKNGTSLFYAYICKEFLFYFMKQPALAIASAMEAEKYAGAAAGMFTVPQHNLYYSLALLADYPHLDDRRQKQALRKVTSNQKKMKNWALHAPSNFQHKYDLVEAEKARVKGDDFKAIEYYEQAIKGAKEQEYTHEEALAQELAGEFHLARGREKMGQFYIIESYYGYIRWGATSKIADLESRYPQLLSKITAQQPTEMDVTLSKKTTASSTSDLLDLPAAIAASQAISSEIILSDLLMKLMKIAMENAGAQKGFLMAEREGELVIEVSGEVEEDDIIVSQAPQVDIETVIPELVLNYVQITQKSLVLDDASRHEKFRDDPYIKHHQTKSILCIPILTQKKAIGMLYVENDLTVGAFTLDRVRVLKMLSSQAAISLENASLYANLETANQKLEDYSRNLEVKVEERTQELQEKNNQLYQTLQKLQETQSQLIQTEKMSSLGQLVAGVAHEINNPINFIGANLDYADEYARDLLKLIELYQQAYPNPTPEIEAEANEMELEFLKEDLTSLLDSMKVGSERISQIVLSLRNFSRLDESEVKSIDIKSGIESSLMILQHRLKKTEERPEIAVDKSFGNLPQVECCAGQLNQVLMNILTNAIDALEMETREGDRLPKISISTKLKAGDPANNTRSDRAVITIADNGPGMTPEVKSKLFDPFFTTKPVGSGTGLGLAVSYQIIVEKHGGQLWCNSELGNGAEFTIEIPVKQNSN